MKRYGLVLLGLLLCLPAWAQDVTLPAKIECVTGRMTSIVISSKAKSTDYAIAPLADVDTFREYNPDPNVIKLRVICYKDGVYTLVAAGATADKVSLATCTIVATSPTPPVPPTPIPVPVPPTPPVPVPPIPVPVPPTPPSPISVVGPLKVLVLFDGKLTSAMPSSQVAMLHSADLASYLDKHCVVRPEDRMPEWRVWPDTIDASAESETWQKAVKRPHAKLPWIILGNKTTGFEGPLPLTQDETISLLKKYGGE